ncbi:MAG: 7-cyano-7-deazaguanine synthase QueC [Acidobacteriota bacterium]|jgi:7-cyano-7-deazaguanine synthase|nr:7-cyano-7-deazaguanine synthase QueC [Acidobacteriota bacterium]
MRKAVALASGGLDSTTATALAIGWGFDVHALSFDYGQRHRCELDAARRVSQALGVREHVVVPIDLRVFGGSALTADIAVPKGREVRGMAEEIPVTYVPARNTVFLSVALAWCEVLGAEDIFIGVNAVDYSGYPDCRPEFLDAFERLALLGTKAGVEGRSAFKIHAPLLRMTKAEIIRAGVGAGVDYSLTHSCYDPVPQGGAAGAQWLACGVCDSCILRRKGFGEAGVPDPTRYAPSRPAR